MKKKALALILTLVMVFSLAACGSKDDKKPADEGNTTVDDGKGDTATDDGEGKDTDDTNTEGEDGSGDDTASKVGGSLVIGDITQSNGDIYPIWTNNASDYNVFHMTFGYSTYALNQDGKYVEDPNVVDSMTPTENEDGSKTFTYKIKDDLKWSNGEGITAKDYIFHLMFFSSAVAGELEASDTSVGYQVVGYTPFNTGESNVFTGLRLLGDYEFSVTIDSKYLPYYFETGMIGFMPSYMKGWLPEDVDIKDDGEGCYFTENFTTDYVKSTVDNYRMNMTAFSGPYMVEKYDETSNTYTLKINPEYKGNFEGQKANIETVLYKYVLSETMMDELSTGAVDLIMGAAEGPEINAGLDLVDAGTHSYVDYPRNGYGRLIFVCDRGPSQFPEVRRAVAYLLDRNEFAKTFTGGYGAVVNAEYGLSQWMVEEAEEEIGQLNAYNASLDAAIAELVAGGWVYDADGNDYKEGIRYKKLDDGTLMPLVLEWCSSENNSMSDMIATMLANGENTTAAGMQIKQTTVSFNELIDNYYQLKENDYNMYNMGIGFTPTFDQSQAFEIGNSNNLNRIADEQLQQLSADMVKVPAGDDETFLAKWVAFQKRFNELLPDLPLYSNIYHDFFTNRLKGYEGVTADWDVAYQLPYCWIEE